MGTTGGSAAVVRRLGEEDWATYRAVRLEMLRESPRAYGMTYDESVTFPDERWRTRMRQSVILLAEVAGEPVGSATYWVPVDEATGAERDPELVAMWVDPRHRRSGIGRDLVEAIVAHAAADFRERLWLSVVEDNDGAARLYLRCGFVDSGQREPNPHQPGVLELRMVRHLRG